MSWGSGFAEALQGVRDSQQRRALFDLDQQARQGFGQAVQDPSLFQGAVPGAGPMPGSSDAYAYGGQQGGPPPDMSLPRGIRNNNPGNITDSPWTRNQPGYVGTDGRFARFESRDAGDRAVQSLLQNYATQGVNTVGGIITKWAPPNENATQDYINFVAKAAGVPPDAPLTPDQRLKVAGAITQYENGLKASAPPPGGMQAPQPGGGPGAMGQPGPGQMSPPVPSQAPGMFEQRQPAGMMSQPGVGPDPSRFGGGQSPPPAGQGGASDESPPGAPPTGQGGPPAAAAPPPGQSGGIDMSRIIAAVQRANPGAKPEVVGEIVKRFLPILTGERTQENADRTFGAGRQDEAQRIAEANRAYATGQEAKDYERNRKPFVLGYGQTAYDPVTHEPLADARDRPTAAGSGKLDSGTMQAIRAADTNAAAADRAASALDGILTKDASGKSLNDRAMSGPWAGPLGYGKSLLEVKPGSGAATEKLTNVVTSQALDTLRAIFGGNPTEGERKVLLEVQGSVNKAPEVRADIYKRAIAAARSRQQFYKQQADEMRGGTYYKPGAAPAPTDVQTIDGVTIRRVG